MPILTIFQVIKDKNSTQNSTTIIGNIPVSYGNFSAIFLLLFEICLLININDFLIVLFLHIYIRIILTLIKISYADTQAKDMPKS